VSLKSQPKASVAAKVEKEDNITEGIDLTREMREKEDKERKDHPKEIDHLLRRVGQSNSAISMKAET
jgi:hypothetical protein